MKPEIKAIILRDFIPQEAPEIEQEVEKLNAQHFNVGVEQLIRSLLYLSNGSLQKFKSFFPIADPRDIVFEAQSGLKSKEDYF